MLVRRSRQQSSFVHVQTRILIHGLVLWAALAAATSARVPTPADPAPAFEVASVKPNETTDVGWSHGAKGQTFIITNMTLRRIIALAYDIPLQAEHFRLVGGPDKVLSRRFDIQAKMPEGVAANQRFSMLRSLLAERFKLQARPRVRQGPVYALVVARSGTLGPELRPSKHNCAEYKAAWLKNNTPASEIVPPRDARNRPLCVGPADRPPPDGRRIMDAGPISHLIASIEGLLDRPLVDGTQLSGNFEWRLTFSPQTIPRPGSEVPSMSVALREQLGLQLERRTGPIDVLVIDSVQMPTPN
jgi:uncharacterized protein (TIGR03435 family)